MKLLEESLKCRIGFKNVHMYVDRLERGKLSQRFAF